MTTPESYLSTPEYLQRRDHIVLEAVHTGTMLEDGVTFMDANMFPTWQQAIDDLVLDAMKNVIGRTNG